MKTLPPEHLQILQKYFPSQSIPMIAMWIRSYGVLLSITRARASKHGDFTFEKVEGMYRISVNGSLSPYAFLLTFCHEVAHLVTFVKYGRKVDPHGIEWKREFRTLMLQLDLRAIYPQDILTPLADYLKNPKASSDRHSALSIAFGGYDQWGKKTIKDQNDAQVLVEQLMAGDRFLFKENREFELKEKRRRLYLCTDINTNKQYLFQPHVKVRIINR